MASSVTGMTRLSSSTLTLPCSCKVSPYSICSKMDGNYKRLSVSSLSLMFGNQRASKAYQNRSRFSFSVYATLNRPKGFGTPPKKSRKTKKSSIGINDDDDDDNDNDDNEEDFGRDAGVIPEVVTNRMISRMGFSVGIPLFIGLLFFPFFYYLKVGLKIDVPTWVPFIVSFFFFGTALLGVSYGIVSSSWDPMREGSLLGWNEAQKNWPVFWQSIWGRSPKK